MLAIILICLFTSTVTETYSTHHSSYISRKSRSSSPALQTGYEYSQVDSDPGRYTTYGTTDDHKPYSIEEPVKKYSDYLSRPSSTSRHSEPFAISGSVGLLGLDTNDGASYDIDFAIAKARSKYESELLPSKMKTDAMYEKLKSVMHYHPPTEVSNMAVGYGSSSEYHVDDDDIRTSTRSSYHGWPYFYHTPYEYEIMKSDHAVEKAKDKRYAADAIDTVIPVHEVIDDDTPNYEIPPITPVNYRDMSTDNPIGGDEAFFSFVLNDYFDRNNEDDPLSFKGFDWGQDFDHEYSPKDFDDTSKRNRRVGDSYYEPDVPNSKGTQATSTYGDLKSTEGESNKEGGYSTKHDFDKHENENEEKNNYKTNYEGSRQHTNAFKNFIDTFANRFGKEDQKKDSTYSLKTNQDKGEKKKGFRKVYHKDEYQEDNEFYDNSNNSAKSDEKGSVSIHKGGSEAILKSHATAAAGNEGNAISKSGNNEKSTAEKNNKGHATTNGLDSQFGKYRDVARAAALSNNADYNDHITSVKY